MIISEYERTKLHHANETRKVKDFAVGVPTVEDTRKIEEFCALINFRPESLFQRLLDVLQSRLLLDEVKVGKDANDFWKSMRLQDVEKLEGLLYAVSRTRKE